MALKTQCGDAPAFTHMLSILRVAQGLCGWDAAASTTAPEQYLLLAHPSDTPPSQDPDFMTSIKDAHGSLFSSSS